MKRFLPVLIVFGLLMLLMGCGSNSSSFTPTPTPTPGGLTLAGKVVKGPMSGATVTAYAVNTDHSNGGSLGSATTDTSGNFSVSLSAAHSGMVRLVATGGTYVSEFDGSTVTNSSSYGLTALVDDASASVSGINITVASTLVDGATLYYVSNPTARAARGRRVAVAAGGGGTPHQRGNSLIAGAYGLSGGTPIENITPTFDKPSIGTDSFTLGLVSGALATCASPSAPATMIVDALMADLGNGKFDGLDSHGQTITNGEQTMPSSAGTTDFLICLSHYVETGKSITDAGIVASDLTDTLAKMSGGISSSPATSASAGLQNTSSGGIVTMTIGGTQYLFVAAGYSGVVVVDVTDATNPVPLKVWPSLSSVQLGSNGVLGITSITGIVSHPQLIIYSGWGTHVAVVNASTLITGTPGIDDASLTDFEFDLPNTSGEIYGAVADPTRRGVWIATYPDGYLLYDMVKQQFTATVLSLNANYLDEEPPDNFALDTAHSILLGGDCCSETLRLSDLSSSTTYYMDPTAWKNTFETDTGVDSWGLTSLAIDPNYQVALIAFDHDDGIGFLNLATTTRNTNASTDLGNTFTPAATNGIVAVNTSDDETTANIDTDNHTAFLIDEYSGSMAAVQLQNPATATTANPWMGAADWIEFYQSDSNVTPFRYWGGQPQPTTVVHNMKDGKSYAYVMGGGYYTSAAARPSPQYSTNTYNMIMQVDLANFMAMARNSADPTSLDGHYPATDPNETSANVTKVITFNMPDWAKAKAKAAAQNAPHKRARAHPAKK